MRRNPLVMLSLVGMLAGACTSSPAPQRSAASPSPSAPSAGIAAPSPTTSGYHPVIDPANFVGVVDNPYLPLTPGTTYVYVGASEGERQRDTVTVRLQTKVILGVPCVVVEDAATTLDGKPLEHTFDWYTQDKEGNVWYFGEDTKEYNDKGAVVSTEGSWESGVDGALPGIVMEAHPQVNHSFRQEYYQGHAEDMFWTLSLNRSATVPYGSFHEVLLTMEWTPLEPKVIDQKYYARGVGVVLEVSAAGPPERGELVSVTRS